MNKASSHPSGIFLEGGMLQAADLNPALAGPSTEDLTIPKVIMANEAKANASQEIATGAKFKSISPLVFVGIATAGLFFLGWLQKKPYFPK